jgi:hypothetical protein
MFQDVLLQIIAKETTLGARLSADSVRSSSLTPPFSNSKVYPSLSVKENN